MHLSWGNFTFWLDCKRLMHKTFRGRSGLLVLVALYKECAFLLRIFFEPKTLVNWEFFEFLNVSVLKFYSSVAALLNVQRFVRPSYQGDYTQLTSNSASQWTPCERDLRKNWGRLMNSAVHQTLQPELGYSTQDEIGWHFAYCIIIVYQKLFI